MTELMALSPKLFCPEILLCYVLFSGAGVFAYEHSATLLSLSVDQWEGTDVTLTCSYTGTSKLTSYRWFLRNSLSQDFASVVDISCKIYQAWLNNTAEYKYSCINETLHSLTLRNITQQRHGETWSCQIFSGGMATSISNTLQIYVKVPVKVASITPYNTILAIQEHSTMVWQCKSSECRPKPKFRWFLESSYGNSTAVADTDPNEIASEIRQAYTSSFSFILNRTWNMWFLSCGASNKDDSTFVLSAKIQMNVTYPPDGPPTIRNLEDGDKVVKTVNVITGDFVYLECSVLGGNPLPRLKWSINDESPLIVSGILVTKNISYQAIRIDVNTELKCQSIHDLIETSILSVNVLYPPETPVIAVKTTAGIYMKVNITLDVIEGQPYTLNCSAKSNPRVSLFKWNDLPPSSSSFLYVEKPDRGHAETITCNVSNVMQISDMRLNVTGMNITQLKVNVLYPPKVNIFRDVTIIEGEDINYTCNFTPGNPGATNTTWSWKGSLWDGQHLQLRNVSRNQAGEYRCSVHNIMAASDGNREVGNSNGTFNLSVQYKSNVLEYIVNDHDREQVTISENDTVQFSCNIEGDPLPTGELLHQRDCCNFPKLRQTFIASQYLSNLRLSSIFQVKCIDTGVLTCVGSNTFYNGWHSTSNKSISLFVNCSPRKNSTFKVAANVTSALNATATFDFTAMAYPLPNFQWYQILNGVSTSNVKGGVIESTSISTNVMQIKFTLENVEESHYGEYLLNLTNQFGSFQQRFYLIPYRKPNPPTQYDFYPDSVTSDSVAIWWEPGFDGGLPQSFIISYNLTSSKWYNESAISHNKERRMYKTITELAGGSVYHILIYAQNEKGAVRVSHAIIVNTKESTETLAKPKSVGPAVGAAVGGLFVVITVTVSLIIVRKRSIGKRTRAQNKACDLSDVHTYQNFQNDGQSPSEGSRSAVYERLQHADFKSDQQYQQLATFSETDKGDGANQWVYENLKLTQLNMENSVVGSSGSSQNISAHNQRPV